MKEATKTRVFVACSVAGIVALLLLTLFIDVLFPVSEEDVALPSLGPSGGTNLSDAPVTIIEFSDFQCPFCAQALPTIRRVKAAYGDKVAVIYKHFPLSSIHPLALRAAEASECARDQGKFWEYHDALFENQGKFQDAALLAYAEDLGLDAAAFKECLGSGVKKAVIQRDFQEGLEAGVQGTPIFLINGRRLEGAQPFSAFKKIIDEELEAADGE